MKENFMEWLTLEEALEEAKTLTITILIELTKTAGSSCHFVEIHGISEFKSLIGNLDKLVNTNKVVKYTIQNVNDIVTITLDDFLKKARRK